MNGITDCSFVLRFIGQPAVISLLATKFFCLSNTQFQNIPHIFSSYFLQFNHIYIPANLLFPLLLYPVIFWISIYSLYANSAHRKGTKKCLKTTVFKHSLTGAEGLEPSTFGFGDQRSANWTIPLYKRKRRILYVIPGIFTYTFKTSYSHPIDSVSLGQALDRLVTVSSMCCHTSTPALSTLSSSRGLTHLCGGYLILRGASRLDAFSVYPFQTWPPCHAAGATTGKPEVRPARSSRTKASSFQISCARAG